mmetsp:Transcript_2655/g.6406  ORF Transcript_2655/g.6406 Transcript_2655/m.6406 type:complete len:352 (+) Transcript_2655:647-1702(+)
MFGGLALLGRVVEIGSQGQLALRPMANDVRAVRGGQHAVGCRPPAAYSGGRVAQQRLRVALCGAELGTRAEEAHVLKVLQLQNNRVVARGEGGIEVQVGEHGLLVDEVEVVLAALVGRALRDGRHEDDELVRVAHVGAQQVALLREAALHPRDARGGGVVAVDLREDQRPLLRLGLVVGEDEQLCRGRGGAQRAGEDCHATPVERAAIYREDHVLPPRLGERGSARLDGWHRALGAPREQFITSGLGCVVGAGIARTEGPAQLPEERGRRRQRVRVRTTARAAARAGALEHPPDGRAELARPHRAPLARREAAHLRPHGRGLRGAQALSLPPPILGREAHHARGCILDRRH